MEQNKKWIRICMISVVLAAVIMGIVYYYHESQEQTMSGKGTLISSCDIGWYKVWQ